MMAQQQEPSLQSKADRAQAGIEHWYSLTNIIPNIIRVLGFSVTSGLIVWVFGQWSDYEKSRNSAEEEFRKLTIEISARKMALRPHLNNLILIGEKADYWKLYLTLEDTKYQI